MTSVLQHPALAKFACLGDKCEDTCCKTWSMQVDEATLERYKKEAPELLDAVEAAGDTPWVMRRDPETQYCVKLEGGLCGIHKKYGDAFLGDACHFYPRATRALGHQTHVMTATLSCPEIARLSLYSEEAFDFVRASVDRLPYTLKNYLPDALTPADALAVHTAFLRACEDDASVELIFARIASVARSIGHIDQRSWPQAVPFYLKSADMRLGAPEANENDPFNLLHALCGLIVASHRPVSERLKQTIGEMEKALCVTLDWKSVSIYVTPKSADAYKAMVERWNKEAAPYYQAPLKKYLQMQLSLALFPFAGMGEALSERITITGVRLATIKLALMSASSIYGDVLPQEVVVRIVQSMSRFLDHLGDPAFSLQIYKEAGWIRETRMQGLIGA